MRLCAMVDSPRLGLRKPYLPVPQLADEAPHSLARRLSRRKSDRRNKSARDRTRNAFAEKLFHAAARRVYRWLSPPTRGMATSLDGAAFLPSTGRLSGVSFPNPS